MPIIGLTGSIGTGKTTVSNLMAGLGWFVIDTDVIAREMTSKGSAYLEQIQERFGTEVLLESGELNRIKLAQRVFANPSERNSLEAILHPPIRAEWQHRAAEAARQGEAKVLVVIPLLYETMAEAEFDSVLCVACSTSAQARRLRNRGWTDDHTRQRLAAQFPLKDKMDRADVLIWNEFSLTITSVQVCRACEKIQNN